MTPLERFKHPLASGQSRESFLIGTQSGFSVYYVPFEYVNSAARLVLVGITPGPTQMTCAYATAHRLLHNGVADEEVSKITKQSCAFIGMREKINEMLDHFGVPSCLGISSSASLWTSHFDLFHVTSIVPNAAFKNGDYFNGPFSAVLGNSLLRNEFEREFLTSLKGLNKEAMFVGMGPVVDEALHWCASRGALRQSQILGYLPHASGASGSQFSYFMRRKTLSELKPKDPVRHRVASLDAAYKKLETSVAQWRLSAGKA